MLDVHLFTDRRFSAASGAVTSSSSRLRVSSSSSRSTSSSSGSSRRFRRGHASCRSRCRSPSPPGSAAPLRPRLGTRMLVVAGLTSFGSAMAWIGATAGLDTSYPSVIVPQMVLMGLGLGLVSTPATGSIMVVLAAPAPDQAATRRPGIAHHPRDHHGRGTRSAGCADRPLPARRARLLPNLSHGGQPEHAA